MERGRKEKEHFEEQCKPYYQQKWDSITQSTNPRTLRRTVSTDSITAIVNALQVLDTSPRSFMHSLQGRRRAPSDGEVWKIRNNDLAVEEILRERREAIESGKLRGRRLFEGPEDEDDHTGGRVETISVLSYGTSDNEHEIMERLLSSPLPCVSPASSSSTSSFVCDDCMGKEVAEMEEEEKLVVALPSAKERSIGVKYGTRQCMVVIGWLLTAIVLVFAICVASFRSFGSYFEQQKVTLVPT